jgi:hypothetical protein
MHRDAFAPSRSGTTTAGQPDGPREEGTGSEGGQRARADGGSDRGWTFTERTVVCEVPVDFRGVMRSDDGRHFVVLKTRDGAENRHLRQGDYWVEIGLTIKEITLTSVLLEDGNGRSFLMRDLCARKARPGASE